MANKKPVPAIQWPPRYAWGSPPPPGWSLCEENTKELYRRLITRPAVTYSLSEAALRLRDQGELGKAVLELRAAFLRWTKKLLATQTDPRQRFLYAEGVHSGGLWRFSPDEVAVDGPWPHDIYPSNGELFFNPTASWGVCSNPYAPVNPHGKATASVLTFYGQTLQELVRRQPPRLLAKAE